MKRVKSVWLLVGVLVIIAAIAMLISVFMTYVTTNSFAPRIELSDKELKMIEELKGDCNCEVKFKHDYDLKVGLTTEESPTAVIRLQWVRGVGFEDSYIKSDDLCIKDSTYLINYSLRLARHFFYHVDDANFYERLRILYGTLDVYGKTASGYSCWRAIVLQRNDDEISVVN